MIPVLLWRCPICGTDDALRQRAGWWKPDRLWCRSCSVTWEVRRVAGKDYWLRVIGGDASLAGREGPLAEWYDRMKSGLELIAIPDPPIDLAMGEILWAKGTRVELLRGIPVPVGRADLQVLFPRVLGSGQLFLTSERLLWKGRGKLQEFSLRRLEEVWPEPGGVMGIPYDGQRYKLRFATESLLKWMTYVTLAARHIEEAYGHRIQIVE